MADWDAVVVGGGPGGAATAARLAATGARVLVLDRAAFPRAKPCGECVNPAGVAALQALGAWPRVLALRPEPLHGWRISSGDAAFEGCFPAGVEGIAVARAALDLALLEHAAAAGAVVREGARVTGVEAGVAGARVHLATGEVVRARVVVGADGLRSVVARRLGLVRRAPRLRKIALTAHLGGVASTRGRGELRVFQDGCVGIASVAAEVANVTVVLGGTRMAQAAGRPAAAFHEAVAALGIAGRPTGPILATGPFDVPVRDVVADGALLVGDAAGYYDPFTGQGIARALRGAALAAEVLLAALDGGGPTRAALRPYARAHRRAFAPGERLQHLVEAFVARPRRLEWALGRLHRRPALGDALIRATGDLMPPRHLLSPRLAAQLVL